VEPCGLDLKDGTVARKGVPQSGHVEPRGLDLKAGIVARKGVPQSGDVESCGLGPKAGTVALKGLSQLGHKLSVRVWDTRPDTGQSMSTGAQRFSRGPFKGPPWPTTRPICTLAFRSASATDFTVNTEAICFFETADPVRTPGRRLTGDNNGEM
jgi:hypothetical protein